MKSNKKHGLGVELKRGNSIYEGEFKNDKRDGLGKVNYIDGSYYYGYWKEGTRYGYVNFIIF